MCFRSPLVREMLAGISECSSSALIVPDASAFAMQQIGKILSTGVTDAGISSYKDINEIVEIGKLFKLDLSQLIWEKAEIKPKEILNPEIKDVLNNNDAFGEKFSESTNFLSVKNPKELMKTKGNEVNIEYKCHINLDSVYVYAISIANFQTKPVLDEF